MATLTHLSHRRSRAAASYVVTRQGLSTADAIAN
jgi:hypothetical protein